VCGLADGGSLGQNADVRTGLVAKPSRPNQSGEPQRPCSASAKKIRTRLIGKNGKDALAKAGAASDVTTVVTSDLAAPAELPELDDVATADVTSAVAALVAPSRIIKKWADPKPYPEPDPTSVKFWPVTARLPTSKQIAEELFAAMQRQLICAGRWVLAVYIENVVCPALCEQLGWPMRPWRGKNGVATHFAKLSPKDPRYFRLVFNGETHNLQHYFIPHPQMATIAHMSNHRRTA